MKWVIHKGKHRPAWWWLSVRLWFNKTILRRIVMFSFNCKYDLHGEDQEDHNKLFGIGYLWSHHRDSARFGWRYDNNKNKFILSAYVYHDGQRNMTDICDVVANREYILSIAVNAGHYNFSVVQRENLYNVASCNIYYWHRKKISYPLGLYFGGNKTAPQRMTIQIKKA